MRFGFISKTSVENQADKFIQNGTLALFLVGGLFSLFFCYSERAYSEEDLEAQRLRGFYEQRQKNERHDLRRLSKAEEVTQAREKWENDRELSIAEYKKEKLSQRKRIDEDSPQYFQNLGTRIKRLEVREIDQAEFVKDRDRYMSQKKGVRLSEMVEYGLNEKTERIDPKKREELSKKIAKSGSATGKSSGGSGSSGGGFSPSPGEAPPPIPAPSTPPEFFDGEIPPPPPPPLDGFDEPPPPPIFDDPDF